MEEDVIIVRICCQGEIACAGAGAGACVSVSGIGSTPNAIAKTHRQRAACTEDTARTLSLIGLFFFAS